MSRLTSLLWVAFLITPWCQQTKAAESDDLFGAAAAEVADPFAAPAKESKKPEKRDSAKPAASPGGREPRQSWEQPVAYIAAESPAATAARTRIELELGKTTQLDYLEMSLKDVVDDISIRHDLPIILDRRALEETGIDVDTPISLVLKGIALRSALRHVLSRFDLTYVIRDEVLLITTAEQAEQRLSTRFYPAGKLASSPDEAALILEVLMSSVAPDSWDHVGGPAHATYLPHLKAWAISHHDDVFAQIDAFFAALARLTERKDHEG